MKVVVVGASSGLGRCIAVGLAHRGAQVALLARRLDRLATAAEEAGGGSFPVRCDVTDGDSCARALDEAASRLGDVEALVYTPAIGPLSRIEEVSAKTWAEVLATNVSGASLVTAAALGHLKRSRGRAVYLSSVSASYTPPWPGLGAYVVSKAALERLVEVWQTEHPDVGFTRLVVGNCVGGTGDGATGFADSWDWDLAAKMGPLWTARGYLGDAFLDIDDLVGIVDALLQAGPTASIPSLVVTQRDAQR